MILKTPVLLGISLYTTTKVQMFRKSSCIFICTKIIQFHDSEITQLFLISQHIFINNDKSTRISFICMYFHILDYITLKIFIYKQIMNSLLPHIYIYTAIYLKAVLSPCICNGLYLLAYLYTPQ